MTTVSERMTSMGRLAGELQLPFYYEADQRWRYQPLKHVQRVDIADLRERLKVKTDKLYPVTDGEGGSGEVFPCNAAAQE
ncbi:hypothetical protein CYMTET_42215 [Cymbomonas tetramitiformis]|uniref:Uncharacterized protein n=1 Tax=Cymbomonas tetramitiformis TaxID=36881 RepID=A0AAE0C5V8_9CHLO|nr:hypothetical protein CYMTET_42215 [Cymbomonas tetramitiformis]